MIYPIVIYGDEALRKRCEEITPDFPDVKKLAEDIFLTLLSSMSAEDEDFKMIEENLYKFAPQIDATYDSILDELGDAEKASPASINFYAKDF